MRSAVDAREEHVQLRSHHIVFLVAGDLIVVRLVFGCLDSLGVDRTAFFIHRCDLAVVFHVIDHARLVGPAIEERAFAILLAVEVGGEGEDVVRCVRFIGGLALARMSSRAYDE